MTRLKNGVFLYVSSVLPPFPPSLQEFTTCQRGSISPTRAFASALTAICRVRAFPLRRSLPGPAWLPGDLRGDLLQNFGRLQVFNTRSFNTRVFVVPTAPRRVSCPASGVRRSRLPSRHVLEPLFANVSRLTLSSLGRILCHGPRSTRPRPGWGRHRRISTASTTTPHAVAPHARSCDFDARRCDVRELSLARAGLGAGV